MKLLEEMLKQTSNEEQERQDKKVHDHHNYTPSII